MILDLDVDGSGSGGGIGIQIREAPYRTQGREWRMRVGTPTSIK